VYKLSAETGVADWLTADMGIPAKAAAAAAADVGDGMPPVKLLNDWADNAWAAREAAWMWRD